MTRFWSTRHAIYLTLIWGAVGLTSAVQLYLAAAARGEPASFGLLTAWQVLNALPWIPVTVLVFIAVRKSPLTKATWRPMALIYLVAGIGVVWGINTSQVALATIAEGHIPDQGFWRTVVGGTLEWGHIAFGVLAVIVAMAHVAYRRPELTAPPAKQGASDPNSDHRAGISYLSTLNARVGRMTRLVQVDTIDWIEAAGDYVRAHVRGESVWLHTRMAELERRLDPQQFARVHRSAIVNLASVREYAPVSHGDYELVMTDGQRIKLSRSRREALERLKRRT